MSKVNISKKKLVAAVLFGMASAGTVISSNAGVYDPGGIPPTGDWMHPSSQFEGEADSWRSCNPLDLHCDSTIIHVTGKSIKVNMNVGLQDFWEEGYEELVPTHSELQVARTNIPDLPFYLTEEGAKTVELAGMISLPPYDVVGNSYTVNINLAHAGTDGGELEIIAGVEICPTCGGTGVVTTSSHASNEGEDILALRPRFLPPIEEIYYIEPGREYACYDLPPIDLVGIDPNDDPRNWGIV